jgi:hypothetical protein
MQYYWEIKTSKNVVYDGIAANEQILFARIRDWLLGENESIKLTKKRENKE